MYDIERGGQAEHGLGQGTGLGQGSAQEQGLGQVYYVPSAHSMSGVNQPAWIVAFNPHDKVTLTLHIDNNILQLYPIKK